MTHASSLAFPGSRTLATWWRQLAPYKPESLGVGYLFVHRVEASASWLTPRPLDPLLALVLEAVALVEQSGAKPTQSGGGTLQCLVRLDGPVLGGLLRTLAKLQLAKAEPGDPQRGPVLTEAGRAALRTRQIAIRQWRRDVFTFVEDLGAAGQRRARPQFLRILEAPAAPWSLDNGSGFDVAWLQGCVREPADWKSSVGFPAAITEFAAPEANQPEAGQLVPWHQLILDKTERLLVVFCQVREQEPLLLGFGVRPEGWALGSLEPIIRLRAAGSLFGELTHEDLASWQAAWQAWCQSRGVAAADAQCCALSVSGERLHVRAPASLIAALRTAKSDVFKGDTWLTAGEGYVRRVGRVEVV